MCCYCMVGDNQFRWDPPWPNRAPYPTHPLIPQPLNPSSLQQPWGLERLREFEDLLKRVKDLEDKLGCPCEPNKADYLTLLRERIKTLEKQVGASAHTTGKA